MRRVILLDICRTTGCSSLRSDKRDQEVCNESHIFVANADVELANKNGYTPLHLASRTGSGTRTCR